MEAAQEDEGDEKGFTKHCAEQTPKPLIKMLGFAQCVTDLGAGRNCWSEVIYRSKRTAEKERRLLEQEGTSASGKDRLCSQWDLGEDARQEYGASDQAASLPIP